jgi:MFS-type transporter involved in bile tolerance (Atg22 family)
MFFIADLIACSTCFGHHYAHHQELENIIQLVAACGLWCLVFKLPVWCGAEGCVSSLWAAAHVKQAIRSAIKKHLLHLVGILFPHIDRNLC